MAVTGLQDDAVVRLSPANGPIRVIGTMEGSGVWAEGIVGTANIFGSDTFDCSFKRTSRASLVDVEPDTPLELLVGGREVWSGRVKGNPQNDSAREQVISAEGMQYSMDDAPFDESFVRTRLGDFKDLRNVVGPAGLSLPDLTSFISDGQVGVDRAGIRLLFPAGKARAATDRAGVLLDLGPNQFIEVAVINWTRVGAANANMRIACNGNFAPNGSPSVTVNATLAAASGTLNSTSVSAVFGTPNLRFLALTLDSTAVQTPAADNGVLITSIALFGRSIWHTAGASNLLSNALAKFVAGAWCPLLDAVDYSQLATGGFVIPDLTTGGYRTPREAMLAAMAFDAYDLQVDVRKRICSFNNTQPDFLATDGPGFEFNDAGSTQTPNSIVLEATDPSGSPLAEATATGVSSGPFRQTTSPRALSNGNFETGTLAGWTATGAPAPAADNTNPDTGTWCAAFGVGSGTLRQILPLVPGKLYRVTFRAKRNAALTGGSILYGLEAVQNGIPNGNVFGGATLAVPGGIGTAYATFSFDIVIPPYIGALGQQSGLGGPGLVSITIAGNTTGAGGVFFVDNFTVQESAATSADRQGIVRRETIGVRTAQTPGSAGTAQRIAQMSLTQRTKTPLRGSGVAWPGGIRELRGGQPVHPAQLLMQTCRLVLMPGRIDPDTGGVGRVGKIINARYTHDDRQVELDFDNSRAAFEAFMERLQLLQGLATGTGGT